MSISGRQMVMDVQSRYSGNGLDIAAQRTEMLQRSLSNFAGGMVLKRVGIVLEQMGQKVVGLAEQGLKASFDFSKQMNLVQTQADLTNRQFGKLSDSARNLARNSGLNDALPQITKSFYDLFSSVTLTGDRVKQATGIMAAFARGAAAGDSDIQTVGRGVIAMNNAYGRSANIKNYTEALDIQFQMVKFGVGTYNEFASSLGQILPSARKAGQSLNTMAGLFAFATRNGMNTAMASVSVARALDLLTRPKSIAGIQKVFGVEIVDKATKQYRNMGDIITDLSKKMEGLTAPQRTVALKNALGNTSDIRAMRFLTIAVSNVKGLNEVLKETGSAQVTGAMQRAFDIMAKSPTYQLAMLTNKWHDALIDVGRALTPLATKVLAFLNRALDQWHSLSEATRSSIVRFIAIGGAFLVVGGALLTVIGSLKMFISLMQLANATMVNMGVEGVGILGPVIGILALLAAGFVYIKNHMEQVRKWAVMLKDDFMRLWNAVRPQLVIIAGLFYELASAVIPAFVAALHLVLKVLTMLAPLISSVVISLTALWVVGKIAALWQGLSVAFAATSATALPLALQLKVLGGAVLTEAEAAQVGTVANLGLLGALKALAARFLPLIGIIVAVKGTMIGLKYAQQEIQNANTQTSNSFLKDTIPTLLRTGDTLQITAAQWRSGPFGSSKMNEVKAVFQNWSSGAINMGQALNQLQSIAGVTDDQVRQLISGIVSSDIALGKSAGDWFRFGQDVTTALKFGKIGINDLATQIEAAHLNALQLKNALDSIPGTYAALINLQLEIDKHGISNETGTIAGDKAMRTLQNVPGVTTRTTRPHLRPDLPSGGGATPKAPHERTPVEIAMSGLHSSLLATQRWVDNLSVALNVLNHRGLNATQTVAGYTKALTAAADKTRSLTAAVGEAINKHLLAPTFLSRAQQLAQTAATLEARWSSLNDRMKSFSDSINGLFGQIGQLSGLTGALSPSSVTTYFSQQQTLAQNLSSTLLQLQKRGLSSNLLGQLGQMSPSDALHVGNLLLQSNIPMINKTVQSISQLGIKTATTLTDRIFGPEVLALKRQTNGFIAALNALIRAINSHLPRAQQIPVPRHQAGGIARSERIGLWGDVPEGEALIPLNRRGAEFVAAAFKTAMGVAPTPNRGNSEVHLHFYSPEWSPKKVVEEVEWSRKTGGW